MSYKNNLEIPCVFSHVVSLRNRGRSVSKYFALSCLIARYLAVIFKRPTVATELCIQSLRTRGKQLSCTHMPFEGHLQWEQKRCRQVFVWQNWKGEREPGAGEKRPGKRRWSKEKGGKANGPHQQTPSLRSGPLIYHFSPLSLVILLITWIIFRRRLGPRFCSCVIFVCLFCFCICLSLSFLIDRWFELCWLLSSSDIFIEHFLHVMHSSIRQSPEN